MPQLIVAQEGGSVDDAEKDLVFTSNRACLIEVISATIDISTDGSGFGTAEVTHDLGYRPSYYAFARDPLATGDWYPLGDGYMGLQTSVDTTKLYLAIDGKEASSTYRVKYYIFGNQLENGTGSGNNNVTGKLRISKPGYDAETETDARNMQFFSGTNVFKVDTALSGSASVTIDDFIKEIVVPHNLGYVPFILVCNDSYYGFPLGQMLPSAAYDVRFSYKIDSTNLTIIIEDDSGGAPPGLASFKYKITRDRIV